MESLMGDRETKGLVGKMDTITRFTLERWFRLVQKYKLGGELRLLRWIVYDRQFTPNQTGHSNTGSHVV